MASILQSPADWISSPSTDENAQNETLSSEPQVSEPEQPKTEQQEPIPNEPVPESSSSRENPENPGNNPENPANPDEPKGDPEMVPVYVKSLLPLFCRTYQSTMISSVKKSSLNLIKKMVYYLNSELLKEVCEENSGIVGETVEVSPLFNCMRHVKI